MKEGLKESIRGAAARILFGPKIQGEVCDVVKDPKSSVTHLLVRTPHGLKHVIHPNTEIGISVRDGSVSVHDFKETRKGDLFTERVRGKGMVLFPWGSVNRNPFKKTTT